MEANGMLQVHLAKKAKLNLVIVVVDSASIADYKKLEVSYILALLIQNLFYLLMMQSKIRQSPQ
jgi:hypothetical protein